VVQAQEQSIMARQVDAIVEFVGEVDHKVARAQVVPEQGAGSPVEHEQGADLVDGIDELLIDREESTRGKIAPYHDAGCPVEAIKSRPVRRNVNAILRDLRLTQDRTSANKPP